MHPIHGHSTPDKGSFALAIAILSLPRARTHKQADKDRHESSLSRDFDVRDTADDFVGGMVTADLATIVRGPLPYSDIHETGAPAKIGRSQGGRLQQFSRDQGGHDESRDLTEETHNSRNSWGQNVTCPDPTDPPLDRLTKPTYCILITNT